MPFRDVIGHRRIVGLLGRSIAHQSLPPSLIFAGPSGIGKRLTAISVAQAFNCLGQSAVGSRQSAVDEADACGRCAACSRIVRGVHPDVLVVEPGESGSIKIDHVRDVIDRAMYRPFEGRRRVVIVDQADALVTPAQNALLKTLEEPPPSSVFILVTSRPDVLLPTVRSRCPQLRFRPLAAGEIADALVARGHGRTEARAIAATADGSLGHALEASAGDLVEARDVAERVLAHAASTTDPRRRIEGAQVLLTGTGGGGPATKERRDRLATRLSAMASILRDTELLSARGPGRPGQPGEEVRALANPDLRPALDRLASSYQDGRGRRAFAAVDRARVALDRNAGVKIVADWLVLQL